MLERKKRPKELEEEKELWVTTNKVCWAGGFIGRVVRVVQVSSYSGFIVKNN